MTEKQYKLTSIPFPTKLMNNEIYKISSFHPITFPSTLSSESKKLSKSFIYLFESERILLNTTKPVQTKGQ